MDSEPRQAPPDLRVALKQAAMMFRQQSEAYRHNRYSPMDKNVRKSMAATLADWARLIEAHIEHDFAPPNKQETL